MTLSSDGVSLDNMYTKDWIYFRSSCVMSSWNKTMCKSFVAKGDIIQQTLWPNGGHFSKNIFFWDFLKNLISRLTYFLFNWSINSLHLNLEKIKKSIFSILDFLAFGLFPFSNIFFIAPLSFFVYKISCLNIFSIDISCLSLSHAWFPGQTLQCSDKPHRGSRFSAKHEFWPTFPGSSSP